RAFGLDPSECEPPRRLHRLDLELKRIPLFEPKPARAAHPGLELCLGGEPLLDLVGLRDHPPDNVDGGIDQDLSFDLRRDHAAKGYRNRRLRFVLICATVSCGWISAGWRQNVCSTRSSRTRNGWTRASGTSPTRKSSPSSATA